MLTGKPFLVTYQYAERAIQNYLKSKENDEHLYFLDKIYVIGYVNENKDYLMLICLYFCTLFFLHFTQLLYFPVDFQFSLPFIIPIGSLNNS